MVSQESRSIPDSCANTPGLTAPASYAQAGWGDGAAQVLRVALTPTQKSQGAHGVGSRNIALGTGLCEPILH